VQEEIAYSLFRHGAIPTHELDTDMKFKAKFDQKGMTLSQYVNCAIDQESYNHNEAQKELRNLYGDLSDEHEGKELLSRMDANVDYCSREAHDFYRSIVKSYTGK